jgi:hypothetical protein
VPVRHGAVARQRDLVAGNWLSAKPLPTQRDTSGPLEAIEVEQRHRLVNALEQIPNPAFAVFLAQGSVALGRTTAAILKFIGQRQKWAPVGAEIRWTGEDVGTCSEREEMAFEPSKHVNGRMWPPGVSGNPNGRPVGSRTVFSQSFLKDLASVWAERGRAAMEKTAIDQPGVFFATCARLIGPEVKLTIEQTLPGNLSMEDWQVMREIVAAVRQAIPDAAGAPPGAVLEHVLSALRQADAKLIG